MKERKRGFTLIELLVVISIIGVLVTIAVANLVSARERARDAARKQQMNELKTALRLYYNDIEEFPGDDNATANSGGLMVGCGVKTIKTPCSIGGEFYMWFPTYPPSYKNTYMESMPKGADDGFWYYRDDNSSDVYMARILLENAGDADIANSQTRCLGAPDGTLNYYVCEK